MGKILFLSNTPTPYQIDFFDELSKRHSVKTVFLWGQAAPFSDFYKNYPWVKVLNYGTEKTHQDSWSDLLEDISQEIPKAVIVGGYKLPLGKELINWSNQRGIPTYFWMERLLPSAIPLLCAKRALVAWRARKVKGIITVGQEAKNQYRKAKRNIVSIPYSIQASKYQVVRKEPGKVIRCLFAGQFIDRKGVSELLGAFSKLPESRVSLTLTGYGPLESEIESYCKRFGNIRLAGFSDSEKLRVLLAEHDLFVFPSKYDGWGVVVTEAMAAGLPVVGTYETSSFHEFIKSGINGMACEVSERSICEAVSYYISHPEKIKLHGQLNSRLLASSYANSQNAVKELERFIEIR